MTLDEIVKVLNTNAGAVSAVSTAFYVVLTVAILLEARATRNLRREALVDARLTVHPPASMLLELDLRNLGPAVARDVVIDFWFTDLSGAKVGESRRQGEHGLGPGERRRFLPSASQELDDLNTLAAKGFTIHVRWSWTDDRRGRLGRSARHEREIVASTERLRADFFGGWALTQTRTDDDLHAIAETARKFESHVKAIRADLARLERRE